MKQDSNPSMVTEQSAANLKRLLNPKSIAFIGGQNIADAVQRCKDFGFTGKIWLVNPKQTEICGIPCIASIDLLPEAPDACFIAVRAEQVIAVVEQLAQRGAGGAIVYASGFAETGNEGERLQQSLITAAGPMALLGPNCYGMLDGLHGSALWPVAHGAQMVEQGVAVITQSGNLAYNLSMTERSVPFAYLISIGNQAMIDFATLIESLLDNPKVKAIGLHLEGLKNVAAFSHAATRALQLGIPIVALKNGASSIGAKIALSHTSSLAGSDELYSALFSRLGIIRVKDPVSLLETLKFLAHGGIPKGRRLAALATSGGDAGLIADLADVEGIEFPEINALGLAKLKQVLPAYATIANPLDFTTTPWGNTEAMSTCCEAVLASDVDAALIVLDYPRESCGERPACDIAAHAFSNALQRQGIPGAVVSVFPDLSSPETAAWLTRNGTPPMQGLRDAISTIGAAMGYGERRRKAISNDEFRDLPILAIAETTGAPRLFDEWDSKRMLSAYGLQVPKGVMVAPQDAAHAASELGFPVCAKIVSDALPHKTEAGAVALRLQSEAAVEAAVERMRASVRQYAPEVSSERILIEKMAGTPVLELIVGIKREDNFGLALVIGAGGVLVELIRDSVTLLLPVGDSEIREGLLSLKLSKLLTGYRGSQPIDLEATIRSIAAIAKFATDHAERLLELDVNPLLVLADGTVAVDALIRMSE